ncbi:hypothetical protein A2U01_0075194, partial [Trifolium medium]|nr:hypothetical protein [Trifolium medium]
MSLLLLITRELPPETFSRPVACAFGLSELGREALEEFVAPAPVWLPVNASALPLP